MLNAHNLTPAEQQIYTLIVEEGISDREISLRLHRSYKGIKTSVKLVRQKLGYSNRTKMIVDYWKARAANITAQ